MRAGISALDFCVVSGMSHSLRIKWICDESDAEIYFRLFRPGFEFTYFGSRWRVQRMAMDRKAGYGIAEFDIEGVQLS